MDVVDVLLLERGEEALHRRVVETVALAAHRLLDAVPLQDLAVGLGGVLDPLPLWWTRPGSGRRRRRAMTSASTHSPARRWSATDQPTISRVARSSIAARSSQPSSVGR